MNVLLGVLLAYSVVALVVAFRMGRLIDLREAERVDFAALVVIAALWPLFFDLIVEATSD